MTVMPTFKEMLKALGFTIITFGSLHLIISYTLMITRDPNEGNLFRILNIQKLFPDIDIGWRNFIISNIIAFGLYFIYLGIILRRSRSPKGLEPSRVDAAQGSGEGRKEPHKKVR